MQYAKSAKRQYEDKDNCKWKRAFKQIRKYREQSQMGEAHDFRKLWLYYGSIGLVYFVYDNEVMDGDIMAKPGFDNFKRQRNDIHNDIKIVIENEDYPLEVRLSFAHFSTKLLDEWQCAINVIEES